MNVTLHIQDASGSRDIAVKDEITLGRTDVSQVAIDDPGLSRKNTTFFIDGSDLLVVDENSLNGTFLNGSKIAGPPQVVRDGDIVKIGSYVEIRIEIGGSRQYAVEPVAEPLLPPTAEPAVVAAPIHPVTKKPTAKVSPLILAASGMLTFALILLAVALYFILSPKDTKGPIALPQPAIAMIIPVRVIDPLGGENEDDLADLVASWETSETEIDASNVSDIEVNSADAEVAELNVTAAFLAEQQKKALEPRPGPNGIRPAGLDVPKELFGDGVIKQKTKLKEMKAGGYHQPLDFVDLAKKRLDRSLIEMPMATNTFYLDVGGSAQDSPFMTFSFTEKPHEVAPGTPEYQTMSTLAGNFAGKQYDLNNSSDRKQMRMRLLRMFQPNAKPILQDLAKAYFQKFGRPLRVTSLTRSMDYQILLNQGNANSFNVRSAEALPPHTSGCAFDLARKHMPVEEQNFVMQELAQMERDGKLDALIEYGTNACFHVFIYNDGHPPKL